MGSIKKKLLTLNDLVNYFSSTSESCRFNSVDANYEIVVQVPGEVNFAKNEDDTDGLLPVVLQSCHIDLNVNGSNIKQEVMEAALPSFSNRPILGYIHEVDGQWEFYGHNMHLDANDELVYDEIPVGVIPESCNARLEYDEEKEKTYCVVNGLIYEEYSKAAEILQREEECAVSVEISVKELSYNAAEKYLEIEKFSFTGVTILGKTPEGNDVLPGMQGSNIKLTDFSAKSNSVFSQDNTKLIETLEKLNHTLETFSKFNIENNDQKGGTLVTKFEELLAQYNVTVEDITFEYENMSDEELEQKFAEVFEDSTGEGEGDPSSDDPEVVETLEEVSVTEDPEVVENMQRTFEISHEDIRYALYNLLSVYEEEDNEWYYIIGVYDNYFAYENWSGSTIYGQKYSKDGDNVAFDGERYKLFKEFLTESEKIELDNLRSNYSSVVAELEKYQKAEEKANKEALFVSESYKAISDTDDFKALMENYEEYSLTDLTSKLDEMLLSYAKSGKFSETAIAETATVAKKTFTNVNQKIKKNNRYGNLKFN